MNDQEQRKSVSLTYRLVSVLGLRTFLMKMFAFSPPTPGLK